MENLIKKMEKEFFDELNEFGFIDDSDNIDRFIDEKAYEIMQKYTSYDDDIAYDMASELVDEFKNNLNYPCMVYEDGVYVYFKNEKAIPEYTEMYFDDIYYGEWSWEDFYEFTREKVEEFKSLEVF